jgi:hypothetical protein
MFPVHASFKGPKYKNKKSMLYNNTSVCIKGLLSDIELDKNTGVPSFFHILVDNIGFLGWRASEPRVKRVVSERDRESKPRRLGLLGKQTSPSFDL